MTPGELHSKYKINTASITSITARIAYNP
uniref:Uncharacterized protein n=1 Tax=Arundo donax TaxID=35708 RepID=A0A0A8YPH7_ARUDO